MNQITVNGWVRVSKMTARRLYGEGKTIRLVPVKVYVDNNMFNLDINKGDKFDVEPLEWELKFDSRVNHFEFYNCQYNELGKYSAYYVRKEELA